MIENLKMFEQDGNLKGTGNIKNDYLNSIGDYKVEFNYDASVKELYFSIMKEDGVNNGVGGTCFPSKNVETGSSRPVTVEEMNVLQDEISSVYDEVKKIHDLLEDCNFHNVNHDLESTTEEDEGLEI